MAKPEDRKKPVRTAASAPAKLPAARVVRLAASAAKPAARVIKPAARVVRLAASAAKPAVRLVRPSAGGPVKTARLIKPASTAGPARSLKPARRLAGPAPRLARAAAAHAVLLDCDVIVMDKPPGMLTVPSPGTLGDDLSLLAQAKRLAKKGPPPHLPDPAAPEADLPPEPQGEGRAPGRGGRDPRRPPPIGVIHRLDREASGLVVFSRSDRAFRWLKQDFKARRVHRVYTVVVEGVLGAPGDVGTIQAMIREGGPGGVGGSGRVQVIEGHSGRAVARPGEGHGAPDPALPRPATTHYKVVATGGGRSLLQVRLETGRKHQIRAHLAWRGCPVVGDLRYGARADPLRRVALHATELGFTHAGTGQARRFVSEPPRAFYDLVGASAPVRGHAESPPTPAPPPTPTTHGFTTHAPPSPSSLHAAAYAAALEAQPQPRSATLPDASPGARTDWERVALWYDQLQDEGGSDHYQQTIIPGTVRLLGSAADLSSARVLDIGCGQGVVCRSVARLGAAVTGVDASEALVAAARARGLPRSARASRAGVEPEYVVGDARALGGLGLGPGSFDLACCVMTLGNVDPIGPVLSGAASLLRAGGALVVVVSHPAFRIPGQSEWSWDARSGRQWRRVDGYLSPLSRPIQMHPGSDPGVLTWTFHRPIQSYADAGSAAGLTIDAIEEWPGQRVSQPGPRAEEENRARREIPLFLALRYRKPAALAGAPAVAPGSPLGAVARVRAGRRRSPHQE
ncbi:MAG: hypothetical protein C0513_00740 [Isosphaera sp.]|nr:hypothetical protein [Isosphaera sp.]